MSNASHGCRPGQFFELLIDMSNHFRCWMPALASVGPRPMAPPLSHTRFPSSTLGLSWQKWQLTAHLRSCAALLVLALTSQDVSSSRDLKLNSLIHPVSVRQRLLSREQTGLYHMRTSPAPHGLAWPCHASIRFFCFVKTSNTVGCQRISWLPVPLDLRFLLPFTVQASIFPTLVLGYAFPSARCPSGRHRSPCFLLGSLAAGSRLPDSQDYENYSCDGACLVANLLQLVCMGLLTFV